MSYIGPDAALLFTGRRGGNLITNQERDGTINTAERYANIETMDEVAEYLATARVTPHVNTQDGIAQFPDGSIYDAATHRTYADLNAFLGYGTGDLQ